MDVARVDIHVLDILPWDIPIFAIPIFDIPILAHRLHTPVLALYIGRYIGNVHTGSICRIPHVLFHVLYIPVGDFLILDIPSLHTPILDGG